MQTVSDLKSRSQRWHPTPFVYACMILHLAALLAFLVTPNNWKTIVLLLLALHAVISVIGLLPRSTLLGRNMTRLPDEAVARREIAITIDDGPDPFVTPKVLAILAERGARATFFCIGARIVAHPELCRAIVSAGHDIENHGQRHRNHSSLFGPSGWRDEISQGQLTINTVSGQTPHFFRPVAGLRNPFLDMVLQQMGLRLASWTRRGYDTRSKNADLVFARLMKDLSAGDILLLHDGNVALTSDGQPVILEVLPRLLDEMAIQNLTPVTLRQACNMTQT